MFGEQLIVGASVAKVSDKERLIMPSFTKAAENDQIVVEKYEIDGDIALKLHIYAKYAEIIKRFEVLRNNASSVEEFEKYDKEIEKICEKLTYIIKVDKQKRVQIPKHLMIEYGFTKGTDIEYIGLGSSLLVRKLKK